MAQKIIPFLIVLAAIVVSYGNCTPPENKLTLASCTLSLQKGFADSYHPFLKQKCSGCHNANPASSELKGKAFGDSNIAIAFNDFKTLGELKIRTFALDPSHQGGVNNGPQNLTLVSTARAAWEGSLAKYENCKATVTGEPPTPLPVETREKPIDSSGSPRIVNRTNPGFVAPGLVAADFKTLTWDLGADTLDNTTISGASFTLKIAIVDNGPTATEHDYAFVVSNPTLINNSGTNIKIENINLKLNGIQYYDGTTFNIVNTIVGNGQSKDLLAVNSTTSSATMVISLGNTMAPPYSLSVLFETLQTTSEAPPTTNTPVAVPTFSSLFGVGGSVRGACIGCHGPTLQSGNGFRVDSFAAVITRVQAGSAVNSRLYQRVTSTTAPMPPPPNALLNATQIGNIQAWINAGAPNN